jgi:hypothetical protein
LWPQIKIKPLQRNLFVKPLSPVQTPHGLFSRET